MLQIAIVLVSILLIIGVQMLRAMLAKQFPELRARALPSSTPPPAGYADLLAAAAAELCVAGLEGPFWFLRDSDPPDAATTRVAAAYREPRTGMQLWLLPPADLRAPNRLNIYAASRLHDGRVAISQAWDPYFEICATRDTPAQTLAPKDMADLCARHRSWVATLGTQPDRDFASAPALLDSAAAGFNRQRARLLANGTLRRGADGIVRPSWRFAVRMLIAYLRRPKPPQDEGPITVVRLTLFSTAIEHLRAVSPAPAVQWQFFAASALVFALLGAVIWNPRYAILLLVVIGIHELGHFVAMRAFGYRNVHMLALPLVGGVTIGHETHPSASRRAWMSLMGPLPGIALGWLLWWLPPSGNAVGVWTSDAAILFLVVNYLNLLPIPPLDGARVIQAMLPPRWYALQAGFIGATCLAGAAGAAYLGMSGLALLALFQRVTIPTLVKNGRALALLLGEGVPACTLPRPVRLQRSLAALEKIAGPTTSAAARIAQAEAVLHAADQPPMPWWQRTLLALLLAALIVVPFAAAATLTRWLVPATVDTTPLRAQIEAARKARAELTQKAKTLTFEELLHGLSDTDRSGADEATIWAAETRLGSFLPQTLAQLYRTADGFAEVGIAPLADLARAERSDFSALADASEMLHIVNEEGAETQVGLDRAARWIRLSPVRENGGRRLYYDWDIPSAIDECHVIELDDHYAIAYPDLRNLLESDWVAKQMLKQPPAPAPTPPPAG